jgi:hypothetical protein
LARIGADWRGLARIGAELARTEPGDPNFHSFFWAENLNIWLGKASKEFIFGVVNVMRVSKNLCRESSLSFLNGGHWVVLTVIGIALAAAGCKREQVTSYQTPKEDHSVKPLSMPGMGPAMMGGNTAEPEESAPPQLKWTVPSGWVEKNDQQQQMGVGAFHVDGADGKYADIKVIPLRAGGDIEQQSVNMWRGELGLPELQADQVKGEDIEVAGARGHLYDLKSDEPRFAGKYKARTTAAIFEKSGQLWFVKMAGEESVVSAQEQNFKNFLKSFRFEGGGMPANHPQIASAGGASAQAAGGGPDWKIPASWKPLPPRQMVIAAYQASKGGASAEVTVSSFPGDVGGLLANVNRWRGQVGLGAIDSGDLLTQVKTIDLSDGSKASVVDVTGMSARTGKAARLYGLIVPRDGKTWFYKMLGDSEAIAAETNNLVEFAGIAH